MTDFAQIDPKRVQIDQAELQKLMDQGLGFDDAVRAYLAMQEATAAQPLGELPPTEPPDLWPPDESAAVAIPSARPEPAAPAAAQDIGGLAFTAHVLRALIDGRPVNGHMGNLAEEYRALADDIQAAPNKTQRAAAFDAALTRLDQAAAAELRRAVFAIDPLAPIPDPAPAQEQEPARYAFFWADAALEPLPPIEWAIDKLFSVGSVNIMFGPPGTKKTWALLDAAVCMATGKDWLGMATLQGTALVIDEESGPQRLKRRLADVMRAHCAGPATPLAVASLAAFNLREDQDAAELHKLITATGARLVIIDALADVMPGGDENAVKDVQPLMLRLRKIANQTQCAIVLIHHSNKAGDYRGSTALPGAVDCMVQVSSATGSTNIDFEVVKSRDGEPFKFAAVARWLEDPAQFHLIPSDPKQFTQKVAKNWAYVLRYMAASGGVATIKDIESNADSCTDKSARQGVYGLTGEGYLQRTDGGKQGTPATYAFTDKVQELLDLLGLMVVNNSASDQAPEEGKL